MFSQIKTMLTDQSSTCIMYANILAHTKRQKTIQGDDLFWGIATFFRNHEIYNIFLKLLGISEDILDEYFQKKYSAITKNNNGEGS